jgi:hypothetical protein
VLPSREKGNTQELVRTPLALAGSGSCKPPGIFPQSVLFLPVRRGIGTMNDAARKDVAVRGNIERICKFLK